MYEWAKLVCSVNANMNKVRRRHRHRRRRRRQQKEQKIVEIYDNNVVYM